RHHSVGEDHLADGRREIDGGRRAGHRACHSWRLRTSGGVTARSAMPVAAARAASTVVTQLTLCTLAAMRMCDPSERGPLPCGVLTTKLILPDAMSSTADVPVRSDSLATTLS